MTGLKSKEKDTLQLKDKTGKKQKPKAPKGTLQRNTKKKLTFLAFAGD
jgi:hypothetical protein